MLYKSFVNLCKYSYLNFPLVQYYEYLPNLSRKRFSQPNKLCIVTDKRFTASFMFLIKFK